MELNSEQLQSTSTVSIVIFVLSIVAMWLIFKKAGQAGWKALIPIYNVYTLVKIVDGNGWKFLLLLIPIVNIIYLIMLDFRMAKAYGKGVGFGFGLLFLPTIFQLILAFGKAQYVGPKGQPR
ncbi:MAG: hypothetical protein IJM51_11765 [Clostridia bacterium]|nr:hypothetical protein [Clostridia bacterium]